MVLGVLRFSLYFIDFTYYLVREEVIFKSCSCVCVCFKKMSLLQIVLNYLICLLFLCTNIYFFTWVDKPKMFKYEPTAKTSLSDGELKRISVWQENILMRPFNDMRNLIDIKDFTYILKQPACNHQIRALILIHSAPRNSILRSLIRQTWGSICRNSKRSLMRVIFLMGIPKTAEDQLAIVEENYIYKDIVQGAFIDSYTNMTYKHTMAFKWFLNNCQSAELLIKCDDDVYLSTMLLHDHLKRFNELDAATTNITNNMSSRSNFHLLHHPRNLILCNSIKYNPVRRTYRAKWRTSFRDYALNEFPPYCLGFVIIYSPDVVYRLYMAAQHSPYFYIDDVHMTGLLARRLNLTLHNPQGYLLGHHSPNNTYMQLMNHLIFAIHGIPYHRAYDLWYMQTNNRSQELLSLLQSK